MNNDAPYYLPISNEVEIFSAAYKSKTPVLLKGPTGCGKTRFVEYMGWLLGNQNDKENYLKTISCHEDLTSTDLVGRFLLDANGTKWIDGPLTTAVRDGSICYLDEVVEARKDTIVVIHALTDHRRTLPIEKTGETVTAHDDFFLVISYNPGYQSSLKDLKHSTRQRFVAIDFGYPTMEQEKEIILNESKVDEDTAEGLALLANKIRNLDEQNLLEGPSTRLLVYAGKLITNGIDNRLACRIAIANSMTDDQTLIKGVEEVIDAVF